MAHPDRHSKPTYCLNAKTQKWSHSLIEVFSTRPEEEERVVSEEEERVVRWCQNCGSVVIDIDYDGRTAPGAIMRMRRPKYQ